MALYQRSPGRPQVLNYSFWRAASSGAAQPISGLYVTRAGRAHPLLKRISLMKNSTYQNNEADNLMNMLSTRLCRDYQLFSDITPSGLSAGLAGSQILLIPELETGAMFADLPVESQALLKRFVNDGGHTLLFYCSASETSSIGLLNLFELNVSIGPDVGSKTLNKVSSPQIPNLPATLPATLIGQDATNALICPPTSGAQPLYVDASNNPVVVSFPYGSGRISYLGWNWYGDTVTTQQAAWEYVLQGLLNV